MDPNANIQEQQSILERLAIVRQIKAGKISATRYERGVWDTEDGLIDVRGDHGRLRELREALAGWLRGGGFEPDWTRAPRVARYYRKAV